MGQRLHVRGVDRHHRVEQEREVDALRLGCELEGGAVPVERPWAGRGGGVHRILVDATEQTLADGAVGEAVDELDGVRWDLDGGNHRHNRRRLDAFKAGSGRDLLKSHGAPLCFAFEPACRRPYRGDLAPARRALAGRRSSVWEEGACLLAPMPDRRSRRGNS